MTSRTGCVGILLICCLGVSVQALEVFGFDCITNNDSFDVAIGQTQLFVEVSPYEPDKAAFTFYNTGPAASVISEIYVEGEILLLMADIQASAGVNYSTGKVGPQNLPGGNALYPQFAAATSLSAEPENPESKWGVGPTEWVKLIYTLQQSKTMTDVLANLRSGELRLGIHVIGFETGGSESFVGIPEPAMWGLTVFSSAFLRLKRR